MEIETAVIIILLILMPLSWLYVSGAFRRMNRFHVKGLNSDNPSFPAVIASFSDSRNTSGNAARFMTDIDEIQAFRLEIIRKARYLIQFETFFMTPGKRARDFSEALRERAESGVTVQLLADSYGAKSLPEKYWSELGDAGVEVRFFSPFRWRSPVDYVRRNHRKLLLVDQENALIGGAGISDWWDGSEMEEPAEPWFDFEVQWQGNAVGMLTAYFWQHWITTGGIVDLNVHKPDLTHVDRSQRILLTSGDDPTLPDSSIRRLFHSTVLGARKRIWIASPYLLPDQETVALFSIIRSEGVEIRILTMGPRSDKPSVYYVSRERYEPILDAGLQIYEYQPSMMHAKAILIDDTWVSLGSANLDPRSFFHNDELNLMTDDPELLPRVERMFETGFEKSRLIDRGSWRKRPWKERVIGNAARPLIKQM